MLQQHDIDYLLMREVEERARAAASSNPAVQAVHLRLAERYADAIWSAEEELDCPTRASGLWPRDDMPVGRIEPSVGAKALNAMADDRPERR